MLISSQLTGKQVMADHDDYCLQEYSYRYQRDLLEGKVALVTGGGSGIGFRITELLMRHGCTAIITSRNADKLREVSQAAAVMITLQRSCDSCSRLNDWRQPLVGGVCHCKQT